MMIIPPVALLVSRDPWATAVLALGAGVSTFSLLHSRSKAECGYMIDQRMRHLPPNAYEPLTAVAKHRLAVNFLARALSIFVLQAQRSRG